jgi:GT2 family glycosyltransferase/SAM-dependent methyltransferase
MQFFARIADAIVADLRPRRVLDVGCAKGFLVESLRDRGVEAFGIDISEYALSEVRPDIRPYCRLASATERFDGTYDLIVCIEVLEHLSEADGRRALANICASASDVLFSSTPDDFVEPTHVNVRPASWWIERFGELGFALDPEFDARFISAHAMRLRAGAPSESAVDRLLAQRARLLGEVAALRAHDASRAAIVERLESTVSGLRAREARLRSDQRAVQRAAEALRHEVVARRLNEAAASKLVSDLRGAMDVLGATNAALDTSNAELAARNAELAARNADLASMSEEKDTLIAGLNFHLLNLQRTIGWKVLERIRRGRDLVLPQQSRWWNVYCRARRPIEVWLDEGLAAAVQKAQYKIRRLRRREGELFATPPLPYTAVDEDLQYQLWVERHRLTATAVTALKAAVDTLRYTPVISIVTPVYNTDPVWLRKAVESVRAQAYPYWELCLADDGSSRPEIRPILDEYAALDPRIRVKHLSENQGIAGASNHALSLASGEFVAFLDHDDEIAVNALFEVAERLNVEPDLDLIYSDEDKLDPTGHRVEPFFKPDWNPDLLLSMNYVTHMSVFRRSRLQDIGGLRLGFDGSQDYDLLLRFTEQTSRIGHIPKILYHWRKIPGSAAASAAAKPFAYEAGRRAIAEALERRGREATVTSPRPGLYTARYGLKSRPLVSIIIPTRDRWPLLQQCLRSIEMKTTYTEYEIVILDNDSREADARSGLRAAAEKWRVFPCPGPFNFSRMNNFGRARARGEYLVFLNNDTQVVEPGWLHALLEQAIRPEVGAVGARLHYPDGRVQHAGLVLGVGGIADHAFRGLPGDSLAHFSFASVVRDVSAVTAACMMVSRVRFEEVGGFDERLQVALNDVDLCLRLRARGYLIVYTPFALLYHHESGTRGRLHPPAEEELMWNRWGETIRRGDPYYNPNLTLSRTDWGVGG